jgi:hypothetical protein
MSFLVSIIFVVLVQVQQGVPADKQAKAVNAAHDGKDVTDNPQVPAPPSEAEGDAKRAKDKADNYQSDGSHGSKRNPADILNAGSTFVIAIFTAFTFGVFLYQIKVTHDSERAWILIDEYHMPRHIDWPAVHLGIDPKTSFGWTIRNVGRTPGRIHKIQLRYRFVENLTDLPARPDYGDGRCMLIDEIPTDGAFVAPDDKPTVSTYFEGPIGEPGTPTQGQMDAAREGKAFLVAYGSIIYEDAFRRRHETRFCYVHHVLMGEGPHQVMKCWFSPGGPKNYNKTS